MPTIKDYVTQSLESYNKGQAIILECEKKAVTPSAEQIAEANKWFDEADAIKKQADTLKRSADLKSALSDLSSPIPIRRHPFGADDQDVAHRVLGAKADLFRGMAPDKYAVYGGAFDTYLRRNKDGLTPDHMSVLAETKALTNITDPEGGFLVTTEFRTEVIKKLRNLVWIRRMARAIETQAGVVAFPTFDPADSQTLPPVAIANQAISQYNLSQLFGKTQFIPHKRAGIVAIPLELIEDASVDVSALLTDFLAMRFAETEENDFINGNGVNVPVGLYWAAAKGALPTQAIAGVTTAMVPEDLVKTVYGIRAVYRNGASWLLHRLVVQAVRLFRTNIGGAGTGMFMFQPSMQAGEPPTLFGYPLLESEFVPNPYSGSGAVAGTPMAMFGNLQYYWIIDRIEMMVQRLNELYAANDQVGFRLRKRYDAAPVLADPFMFLTRN